MPPLAAFLYSVGTALLARGNTFDAVLGLVTLVLAVVLHRLGLATPLD